MVTGDHIYRHGHAVSYPIFILFSHCVFFFPFFKICNLQGKPELRVEIHPTLFDCLLVHNTGPHLPQQQVCQTFVVFSLCLHFVTVLYSD